MPDSSQLIDQDLNAITGNGNAFPGETNGVRDSHGTSCAGIVAMEKSNRVCGVGVAYQSRITGECSMIVFLSHQYINESFVTCRQTWLEMSVIMSSDKVSSLGLPL